VSTYSNPLTRVTIGAGVTLGTFIHSDDGDYTSPAFPLDLDTTYNGNGKKAGTYTRPNTSTTVWTLEGATATQTPVASDYTIGNLNQTAGSVTAVTITAKSGKSPGAVSNIRYNNSTAIPQTPETYPVTFDVAAATGWNAVTGLSAGNLVVSYSGGGSVFGDFYYTQTATAVTIDGYKGTSTDVTIPSLINGKPVTAIGDNAFWDKQLTSVNIPDSVTIIGRNAFLRNQLTSVSIPNGVTTIGEYAFYDNKLTGVLTIPNKVTFIGYRAFGINNLTNVIIPNSVTTIEGEAFENNQLTSVTIPNSITTIEVGVFADNLLTSIIIPNSVTTIGLSAFHTNKLASVTIPNNVTTIGYAAFWENPLTSVTIGGGVTLTQPAVFESNLDNIYNSNGKLAGMYTRPNTSSTAWTRQ